jgi:hypothetical protein
MSSVSASVIGTLRAIRDQSVDCGTLRRRPPSVARVIFGAG